MEDEEKNELKEVKQDSALLQTSTEDEKPEKKKKGRKVIQEKEVKAVIEEHRRRGVCYLSRIPPHLKPFNLRQLLSEFGEVLRIYLAPEDPMARLRRKKAGGSKKKLFSEGWVEFANKKIAKRVAMMLNGQSIGGKHRSPLYHELWNIKYLHKFKWDNLTEELVYKNAVRDERMQAELSSSIKEREFYLGQVDRSRAFKAMEERREKKKRRLSTEEGGGEDGNYTATENGLEKEKEKKGNEKEEENERKWKEETMSKKVSEKPRKMLRKFPQLKSVSDVTAVKSNLLSSDILSGVFGQG